jgi:phytoene desaturase
VNGKSAIGVLVNRKEDPADIVVSNADVKNTYKKLLPEEKQPAKILSQVPSTSALVFYWGINKTFPNLELHNIFFSADYKKEFDYLTNKRQVCNDPTIYVNISSKVQAADAPAGCENWFTMINAPYDSGQDWKKIVSESRSAILEKLSRMLNSTIRPHIVSESILTPQDIENRTASYLGALYGSSSNNRFAAFLRHKNFSSGIRNLYFCGGSVHPGGGIPLCLLSASIVSDLIRKGNV